MDNYQKKYRVPSARTQWWDYSWAAAYFITICTKNRAHYFGRIDNQKMHLSQVGVLADVFWHEIPKHFNTVELGAFVIMPNHMHGLLIIHSSENSGANPETAENIGASRYQNQGKKTVSAMVRNDAAYQRISDYIESNPLNWPNKTIPS
jgi:putative transposase